MIKKKVIVWKLTDNVIYIKSIFKCSIFLGALELLISGAYSSSQPLIVKNIFWAYYGVVYPIVNQPLKILQAGNNLFKLTSNVYYENNFIFINRMFLNFSRFIRLFYLCVVQPTNAIQQFFKWDVSFLEFWKKNFSLKLSQRNTKQLLSRSAVFNSSKLTSVLTHSDKKRSTIFINFTINTVSEPRVMRKLLWAFGSSGSIRKKKYKKFLNYKAQQFCVKNYQSSVLFYIMFGAGVVASFAHFKVILNFNLAYINGGDILRCFYLNSGDIISFGYGLQTFKWAQTIITIKNKFILQKFTNQFLKMSANKSIDFQSISWLSEKAPLLVGGKDYYYTVNYQVGVILVLRNINLRSLSGHHLIYWNSYFWLSYWRYNG